MVVTNPAENYMARVGNNKSMVCMYWSQNSDVYPMRHLSVAVSRCAALIELKEDGRLCSFLTIDNHGPSRIAYRILPSVLNRYTCRPSFGCLDKKKTQIILIYTTSFPGVLYGDIAADEFITEVIPIHRLYAFPKTIEWLFSSEKYHKDDLRRFNSVFMKPIMMTRECIRDSVHGVQRRDSRASESISTAKLDKLVGVEQVFLNKVLSHFYEEDRIAKAEWSTLILPGAKYGILSLVGLFVIALGCYKVIPVLKAIGAW